MKVYLAAPIFNDHQLEVVEFLKTQLEYNHQVFSPYHESVGIWQGRAPKDCSPKERQEVVYNNVHRLDWCDMVLAWVGGYPEGFTDPGVLWELGYAGCRSGVPALEGAAARFPCSVGYVDDTDTRRGMNLMLAGTLDAFVIGVGNLDEFLHVLLDEGYISACSLFKPELTMLHEEEKLG